jgi:hypothetical protein
MSSKCHWHSGTLPLAATSDYDSDHIGSWTPRGRCPRQPHNLSASDLRALFPARVDGGQWQSAAASRAQLQPQ